ncbi:MAG: response regulator [Spirochaetes bacterium]|jgi:DNA-binding response OmpR family regulator|nr:response regulator [Spirochaetota bacterium]
MATILIVNENANLTGFLKFILETAGYQTKVLDNGLALFDEADADPPSLVVMDTSFKYVDGLYLLEKFKSRRETASIPVLVVASKNEPLALIDAIERGAYNYMAAPVNEDAFLSNVKKCLTPAKKNQPGRRNGGTHGRDV